MADDAACRLRAAAEPASLDRVHELLDAVWSEHGDVSAVDRMRFAIAVTEVAGNIVQHTGRGPGLEFCLTVLVRDDVLEAEFSDPGRRVDVDLAGVDLPDDLAESGRGLALALRCVDELEYRRLDEVNHWRLARRRVG